MKIVSAVLVGCLVAIIADQALALPQRAELRKAALRVTKNRVSHHRQKVTEESLAKQEAKLKAAAAEYKEKGLPTVNVQEIRERAQQAVERAKSSPTNWKAWEKSVQAKMAERKQASTAVKGEKILPQKTYVNMQKFHKEPVGHAGQDLRQEIAAEAMKIPKTIPHPQQTLAKQQSSHPEPKTVPHVYPAAANKKVMQQTPKSYTHGPGMEKWDEEKMRQFMQLSDEKKMEITKMMKEKAKESASNYPHPSHGYGYPQRGYGYGYPKRG